MQKALNLMALGFIAAGFAMPGLAVADDNAPASPQVTYYKNVAPIIQAHCQDCHRPAGKNLGGMVAPMSFMTYDDLRPWVKSISKSVKSRQMPPWYAAPKFHGVFRNENTLTDEEIATIEKWATSGAPAGDPKDAPAPKNFGDSEWSIGKPDFVLTFEKPFLVGDSIEDLNTNVIVNLTKEMLPEDKFIEAFEFRPGSSVVHHILGFVKPPVESGETLQMIGGIAPGSQPVVAPEGYGIKLHTNSKFIFQMHYHKEKGAGTAIKDVSSIAFKFASKPVHRLYVEAVGDPAALLVPPHAADVKIASKRKWDRDFIVAGYLPHMHLRGTYSNYEMTYPDGKKESVLETPTWDFNWQIGYEYPEPRRFPAGSILEVTMGYNNSAEKFGNPDPTKTLTFGSATTDEMNLGWITWGYAEPTDHDPVPRAIGGGNDDLPRPKRERKLKEPSANALF